MFDWSGVGRLILDYLDTIFPIAATMKRIYKHIRCWFYVTLTVMTRTSCWFPLTKWCDKAYNSEGQMQSTEMECFLVHKIKL